MPAESLRASYDVVAEDYAQLLRDELAEKPLDRALLDVFSASIRAGHGRLVGDFGCGPGRIGGYLAAGGLVPVGIDLSAGMVAVARREWPALAFAMADLRMLPFGNRTFAGAIAWYSLIHLDDTELPIAVAEIARVLEPHAPLLVAFQVGDGHVDVRHAYGHDVAVRAHTRQPDAVADVLDACGLTVSVRVVRAAAGTEKRPQAYLLAARR